MRTLYFGTPEFAVPTLSALVDCGDYAPLRVVTQPSRPVGRGRRMQDPPVASWAREHGLEVWQPPKVRAKEFLAEVESLEPDVCVVVAFGQIFPKALLEIPRLGCVNLHGSLLPKYRGAAPIQAAIAAGEKVTGVTTMSMGVGLDDGPMLLEASLEIGPEETSPELAERLADLGAPLMVETLRGLEAGTVQPRPQDHDAATYAPRIQKTDGRIDWHKGADEIYDLWRAYTPWPGLATILAGKALKIVKASPLDFESPDASPGTLLGMRGDALAVACGGGTVLGLMTVQRPGRKAVSARDLHNGERLREGDRFEPSEPE